MAVCEICDKRYLLRPLNARLDIPEYRMMTGFWPWAEVRVCDACLEDYDREFAERLRLLAPDVLENDEPVAEEVCLACGTIEPHGGWHLVSRWVDGGNRPVRRATFYLCGQHKDLPYVEGIVVSSNLLDLPRMEAVLDELPAAGGDLLARVEGWRVAQATSGPPGAMDFAPGWKRDAVAAFALESWKAKPAGLGAKAAWLGPIRKDYRLRYRLDLVRDFATHQREALSIIRVGRDSFATYRTMARTPGK
jgi:hypothetical protein